MAYLISAEQFKTLMLPSARNDDKLIFKLWENGSITTGECCMRFLLHNGKRPEDYEFISHDAFVTLLNSLGYRRRSDG